MEKIQVTRQIRIMLFAAFIALAMGFVMSFGAQTANADSANLKTSGAIFKTQISGPTGIQTVDLNATQEIIITNKTEMQKGTWTVGNSDSSVVEILKTEPAQGTAEQSGNLFKLTIKGKKIGSCKLTVQFETNEGIKSKEVEVSISVRDTDVITVGDIQVVYKATKSVAVTCQSKSTLKYTSQNTSIATVEATATGCKVVGKKPGKTTITITSEGNEQYKGATEDFIVEVTKASQSIAFSKQKNKTVAYKKLRKKAQSVKFTKATKTKTTVTYKVTKVTYKKKASSKAKKRSTKYFTLKKSTTPTLTVKKGLAKGYYTVSVKATAKSSTYYNASKSITRNIVVRVK